MTRIAFFGHNAHDAAVKRRIAALADAGADIIGFTMRRGPLAATAWENVDLAETRDAAFAQRLAAVAAGLARLKPHRDRLAGCDVWFARNLDMLALAVAARTAFRLKAEIVYECLDIHRLMTRTDAVGAGMRALEAQLLAQTRVVIVSSPGFLREYFEPRHRGRYQATIIENRLPAGLSLPPRPAPRAHRDGPIRIGLFGNLRCRRSLSLLRELAKRLPDRVEVILRGYPATTEIPDFDARVDGLANLTYKGKYRYPDDLAEIYGELDFVWAGDFHDAQFNSRWLLPNRLYEGGYFGVPPIAPADSETGRWMSARGLGVTLAEPLEETLGALLVRLRSEEMAEARAKMLAAPTSHFLAPRTEMADFLADLASGRISPASSRATRAAPPAR
jgi:succinoglycan biosynthesis protein ExoL